MSDSANDGSLSSAGKKLIQECNDAFSRVDAQQRKVWSQLAGSLATDMLQSREKAEQGLTHSDGIIRSVAIEILLYVWRAHMSPSLKSACERLAIQDSELDVRVMAVIGLGACYEDTHDPRIGRLLAGFVYDNSQGLDLRSAAYQSLYYLRGEGLSWPELTQERFTFPDDIDWSFVASFLPQPTPPRSNTSPLDTSPPSPPVSADMRIAFGYYRGGLEALQRSDYEQAIALFSEAIKLQPTAAGSYRMRAISYVKTGNLEEAVRDLSRTIELNPGSSPAYHERSQLYRQQGLIELAEKDYQTAVALDGFEEGREGVASP